MTLDIDKAVSAMCEGLMQDGIVPHAEPKVNEGTRTIVCKDWNENEYAMLTVLLVYT